MVLKNVWKSVFGASAPRSLRRANRGPVRLEALESRYAPAVNMIQAGGVLTITGNNASDIITITERDATGEYQVVATEQGGSPSTRQFSRVTSIVVRTGGGDGNDVVNFLSESGNNRTGLTGSLTILGSGNGLDVNLGSEGTGNGQPGQGASGAGNVNVRGATTINFTGSERLAVNITGEQASSGGTSGSTVTGTQLGALTITSSSGAADSDIAIDGQTQITGAVRITTAAGDDVLTLDQARIRGSVTVNAGAGDNDFILNESTVVGSLTYASREDGSTASADDDDDFSLLSSTISGGVTVNLANAEAVGLIDLIDSNIGGPLSVQGGNDAEVIMIDGTSVRGSVTLTLAGGEADQTAGARAGSTVVITDFSRISGNLTQTGSRNLDFMLDGDSIIGGNISLVANGGSDASTITLGGRAIADDPNTPNVDESSSASGAYVGGSFRYTGGSGIDTIAFNNAILRGPVTLALAGNGGGSTGQEESTITLANTYIRGGLTQTGVTGGTLTYTQTDATRIEGPVRLQASNSGEVDVTIEQSSTIGGSLTVTSGSGDDSVAIDGSDGLVAISGGVQLSLGQGTADVSVTTADISGAFSLTTSASPNAGDDESTTLRMEEVRITGALTVRSRHGDDRLEFDDVSVYGPTTLDSGEGDDVVVVRNSDFAGLVTLNTGDGADAVYIEAAESGMDADLNARDTVFRSGFNFRGGNDTDSLILGSDGTNQAVFLGSVSLNGDTNSRGDGPSGGSPDDTMDDRFAIFLGSMPMMRNFDEA